MWHTLLRVGGVRIFQAVHAMPPNIKRYTFTMLLETLSYSFPDGATCVSVGSPVCYNEPWFFFSISHFNKTKLLQF
jgi:hypothetical protein